MIQEFKDFISRGNLIEIAVAFVMGVAFAAMIASLTNDIINPIISKIFDVQDLADWVVWDIRISAFLVAIINFLIVAFVMFLVVKAYNRMKREEVDDVSSEIELLGESRDRIGTPRPSTPLVWLVPGQYPVVCGAWYVRVPETIGRHSSSTESWTHVPVSVVREGVVATRW